MVQYIDKTNIKKIYQYNKLKEVSHMSRVIILNNGFTAKCKYKLRSSRRTPALLTLNGDPGNRTLLDTNFGNLPI